MRQSEILTYYCADGRASYQGTVDLRANVPMAQKANSAD